MTLSLSPSPPPFYSQPAKPALYDSLSIYGWTNYVLNDFFNFAIENVDSLHGNPRFGILSFRRLRGRHNFLKFNNILFYFLIKNQKRHITKRYSHSLAPLWALSLFFHLGIIFFNFCCCSSICIWHRNH